MKSRLSSMVALLLIAVTGSLVAQDLDIAGRVYVQSTNEPLAGANIRIKGTYVGTTSDAGGGFRLQVREAGDATVIVSYLGYKTVESYVTRTSGALSIGMEEDVLKTSEVVVTGLASSVKRENLANAVATVSAKELVGAPAQTLDQALAGKFAGISISQNTGAPGGGIYIDLRGVSTIEGSTQPLFVIDGVIISNSEIQSGIDLVTKAAGAGSRRPQGQPASRIADINPYDIENIEVLKGASAAAIYGAKATNGVVIITTKRGGTGEARVEINQLVGMNNLLRKIGTRKFTRQTAIDTYGAAYGPIFDQNGGRFIDYEEEMYGETGMIYETTVSTRGGTESTHYFVSGVSRTEDGIIQNTGYSRYGGRLNLNHRITDRANVSLFTNFLRTESNRAITGNDNTNTTLGFSLAFTPSFLNILPKNGVYPDHTLNPSNPFHTRDVLKNTEQVNRSIAAVQLTWNLLRTNEQLLDFSAQAGVDYFTLENKVLSPPELQFERNSSLPGASVVQQTSNTNSNLYLNLVHNYTSGPSATFRTSAGLQFEALDRNSVLNEARGLIVTQTNVDQAASVNALQEVTIQRDWGFFVQEEVNLSDQYFLTAGVRGDRSSTVGDTKSMLFFPKGSASVRLSKFDFWEDYASIASEVKLRAAYGETGNLPPPEGKFTAMGPQNIGGLAGLLPLSRRGRADIKPERTREIEFGADATFWDERGLLEITWYRQDVSDLILIASLPPSSGFIEEFINGGEMRTQGVELGIVLTPIREPSLSWTSRVNFYKNTSRIKELSVDPFNTGGFATFLGTYRIQKDLPPTTIIGADVDASGKNIPLGDENPDFRMSFNNRITWNNFELNFLVEWKQGGHVINLGKLITDLGGTTEDYDELGQFTLRTADGRDSVATLKNGQGRLQVLGLTTKPYIEDGTYIKLREATLTYNVDREFLRSVFGGALAYLRLGLTGRNLLVITDYTGYDPEVSQFGSIAIGRSVDTLPFPSSRSFYFNISLGL